MVYLTTEVQDYGSVDFGCRGYGGLMFTHEPQPSTSVEKEPIIVQHNLAHYWHRHGLVPRTVGFPLPLLGTNKVDTNNEVQDITVDQPSEMTFCRNLLAGELDKRSTNHLRLWAVNELSDRMTMVEHTFQISEPNSEKSRLIKLKESPEFCARSYRLSTELCELRTYQSPNSEKQVIARCRDGLILCDTSKSECQSFYEGPIKSFMPIPNMDKEMVVLDILGNLWWAEIGECFARIKTTLNIKTMSPTDHPRIILASDGSIINFLDLREDNRNKTQKPFFKLSTTVGERYPYLEIAPSDKDYKYLIPTDTICHMNCLYEMPWTCMVTTDKQHILMDERMPGNKILEIGHTIFRGGDYYLSPSPFYDTIENGLIYSYYGLNHSAKESLVNWSIYFHKNSDFWSSLGPIYQLKSPRTASNFTKLHSAFDQLNEERLPDATRAIHYQPLPATSTNFDTRAFLFRMMDNGELWYENVMFSPEFEIDSEVKTSYRKQSIAEIHSYCEKKYPNETTNIAQKCEIYDISYDIEELRLPKTAQRFPNSRFMIGKRSQPVKEMEKVEIVNEIDEEHIMSDIILKQWKRVQDYCNNLITEKIEYKYKNDTYIGKWTPGIRQARNLNDTFEKLQKKFKPNPSTVGSAVKIKAQPLEESMKIDQPDLSTAPELLNFTNIWAKEESFSNQLNFTNIWDKEESFSNQPNFNNVYAKVEVNTDDDDIDEENDYDFEAELD